MIQHIMLASTLTAFTFGYNELKCGSTSKPMACAHGAITASGETFKPNTVASAAIPLPRNMVMRPTYIYVKTADGPCVAIRLNDKANARWVGRRGFEFSPAALVKLGIRPSRRWTGRVEMCYP